MLTCFGDADSRLRYYACEALYNIVKVARGAIVPHFNVLFDGLSKVTADEQTLKVENSSWRGGVPQQSGKESRIIHVLGAPQEEFWPLKQPPSTGQVPEHLHWRLPQRLVSPGVGSVLGSTPSRLPPGPLKAKASLCSEGEAEAQPGSWEQREVLRVLQAPPLLFCPSQLAADPDPNVKSGSELLDRLLKVPLPSCPSKRGVTGGKA